MPASPATIRSRWSAEKALPKVCAPLVERARNHFAQADEIMKRNSRRQVRAPRIMSKYYRTILELLVARGFALPARRYALNKIAKLAHSSLRFHLMTKNVHIIGAGVSGLAAAVRLANAGYKVHVHEATQQPGGRCRSYFDAATNLTIDNGNHLLLSRKPPCGRLCQIDRHRSRAGRAAECAISLCGSHDRPALETRSRRQPVAALGL